MAKSELKLKARELRSKGESVRSISKKLGIAKSTASIWVRDIVLSVEQLEYLKQSGLKGRERGRLIGSLVQKQRRLDLIEKYRNEGIRNLETISQRELMLVFLSLYWAEGSKKGNSLRFCNSDPELVILMIKCLIEIFEVPKEMFSLRVGINEIHKDREELVRKYWSETTGFPLLQFRKTSFKKAKVHKIYENFSEHYGTLDVTILKSADLCYKIMGLIKGLASQGSSMVVAQHS